MESAGHTRRIGRIAGVKCFQDRRIVPGRFLFFKRGIRDHACAGWIYHFHHDQRSFVTYLDQLGYPAKDSWEIAIADMKRILRKALLYFGLFFLLYGSLTVISLVPSVMGAFNQLYCKTSSPVLQVLLPGAYLQMRTDPDDPVWIRVEYADRDQVTGQMEQARLQGGSSARIEGKVNLIQFNNLFLEFLPPVFNIDDFVPDFLETQGIWMVMGYRYFLYIQPG